MEVDQSVIEIENPDSSIDSAYENKGFVRLPISEDDFEEFICNLLGEPQTIQGTHFGNFEINLKTIEDIHYLLMQRINQQNQNRLVQFSAQIMFNDNSSVKLSSFDELITYNEIRSVIPMAIHVTWVFLVKFQDKNTPEKQVVDIVFASSNSMRNKYRSIVTDDFIERGAIRYSIKHTARSWGVDIEFLLSNKLKSLLIETSKVKKLLTEHTGLFGLLVGITIFAIAIIGSLVATTEFTDNAVKSVFIELQKNVNVNDKVDFIANYIASGTWFKFTSYNSLFTIIMAVVSIAFGLWVGITLEIEEPSFILITEEAKKYKIKTEKKLKRKWLKFFISVIISILCSVISSYIFTFLSNMSNIK